MERVGDNLAAVAPAIAFLCSGVALAALLDRLGFFEAVTDELARRHGRITLGALWWMAAATTVVLNLDTTIVLLTPLYVRLARRSEGEVDVFAVALVPLFLASFASSVLPVSNLTNLIFVERLGSSTADVFGHLALPSLAASVVGWACHRRRLPEALVLRPEGSPDRTALGVGGVVVASVLVGFVAGPAVGVDAWLVALVADLVLVAVTRWVPWREVPLATAAALAAAVSLIAVVVPEAWAAGAMGTDGWHPVSAALGGAALANVVNNLPALLVALEGATEASPSLWGWLLGVNTAAVLVPIGALANLLWWRIVDDEGVEPSLRAYLRGTLPVALPAFGAALAALALVHAL